MNMYMETYIHLTLDAAINMTLNSLIPAETSLICSAPRLAKLDTWLQ